MKKIILIFILALSPLYSVSISEQNCISGHRKNLDKKLDECRKKERVSANATRKDLLKRVTDCAAAEKEKFKSQVKQCYEVK